MYARYASKPALSYDSSNSSISCEHISIVLPVETQRTDHTRKLVVVVCFRRAIRGHCLRLSILRGTTIWLRGFPVHAQRLGRPLSVRPAEIESVRFRCWRIILGSIRQHDSFPLLGPSVGRVIGQ